MSFSGYFKNFVVALFTFTLLVSGSPVLPAMATESPSSPTVKLEKATATGDLGETADYMLKATPSFTPIAGKDYRVTVLENSTDTLNSFNQGGTSAKGVFIGECYVDSPESSCLIEIPSSSHLTIGIHDYTAYLEESDDGTFSTGNISGEIGSFIATSTSLFWERKPLSISLISNSMFIGSGNEKTPLEEKNPSVSYTGNQFYSDQYTYYTFDITNDLLIASQPSGNFKTSVLDLTQFNNETSYYQTYLAATVNDPTPINSASELTDIIATSNLVSKTRRPWSVTINYYQDRGVYPETTYGGGYYQTYLEDRTTGEIFWGFGSEEPPFSHGFRGHPANTTDWAKAYIALAWDTESGVKPTSASQLKGIIADSDSLKDIPKGPGMSRPEESHAGWNPTDMCQQACSGDPINNYTGEFFETTEDMTTVGTLLKPTVTRHFSTILKDEFNAMGYGWRHSYEMKIQSDTSDPIATTKTIKLVNENGSKSFFYRNADGTYSAPGKVKATLSRNATSGEFTLLRNKKDTFLFGSEGKLKSIKNLNGNVVALSYYTSGRLYRATDVRGNILTFTYYADGTVSSVTDQNSRKVTYSYTSQQLTSTTDHHGVVTKYTYDTNRRVTTFTNPIGGITKNFYDDQNRVTKQDDPTDKSILFSYAGSDEHKETTITYPKDPSITTDDYVVKEIYSSGIRIKKIENPNTALAREWNYSYDSANNMTSVVNPDGSFTSSLFDSNDNMIKSVNPLGGISTFTYDAKGNVLTSTNPLGKISKYTYDSRGNLTSEMTPLGHKKTMVWNSNGTLQSVVDARGNKVGATPADFTTSIGYDSRSLPTSSSSPLGVKTVTEYDTFGRPVKMISPRGNVTGANPAEYTTSVTYDALDLPAIITNPKGDTTSATYVKSGDISTITDDHNSVTTNYYAPRGNLIQTKDAVGGIEKYYHDESLRLRAYTDKRGKVTWYSYDALGRMISIKNALGQVTTFDYDIMDRVTGTTDPEGHKIKTQYDFAGNPTVTIDALGNTSRMVYNNAGQHIASIDSEGKKTSYIYDNDGILIETTSPDFSKVKVSYDAVGNLISKTNGDGKIESWTYDALNRKTSHTNAENKLESYEYDASSNIVKTTRRDGSVVTATYDQTDLPTALDYPGTDSDVSYAYDSLGRTTTETNNVATTTTVYDALSRIASRGTPNKVVTYGYDAVGNSTSLTYPSGRNVAYTYNNVNNISSLTSTGLGNVTFAYNKRNMPVSATLPNGVVDTKTIDPIGRQTGLLVKKTTSGNELFKNTKTYTPANNLESSSMSIGGATPVVETYAHDLMDRTTKSVSGVQNASGEFAYTTAGVLTSLSSEAVTSDNVGKPLTVGTKTLGYDALGNRTSETMPNSATRTFGWNTNGTLAIASAGSAGNSAASYTYTADGLLASKTSGTDENKFVWDSTEENALMLSDGDFEYIYGPDRVPFVQIDSATGATQYLHSDQNGSVVAVTDGQGILASQINYSTYGKRLGTSETRFGFAGEWTDESTGFTFLRARWYDATTGSFISEDPIVQITGESYGYVRGNPLARIDPSGLFSIDWTKLDSHLSKASTAVAIVATAAIITGLVIGTGGVGLIAAAGYVSYVGFGAGAASTLINCTSLKGEFSSSSCHQGAITTALSAIPFMPSIARIGALAQREGLKYSTRAMKTHVSRKAEIAFTSANSLGLVSDLSFRRLNHMEENKNRKAKKYVC